MSVHGGFPADLEGPAERLIAAARDYWEAYHRHGALGGQAVVWLGDNSGALVVFTRGEYRDRLVDFVESLDGRETRP